MPPAPATKRATFPAEAASTRERILEAALDAFAEYGYDGTTTREICKRAGVNVAAVNYHWGSKEDLWMAVCRKVSRDVIEVTTGCFEPGLDVEEMVPEFLSTLWDYLIEDPRPVRIGMWAGLQADSMDYPTVFETFLPFMQLGVEYFQRPEVVARTGDVDVEVLITTFYGHFVQAFLDQAGQRLYFGRDLTDPEHAERVKRSIIRSAMILLGLRDAFEQGPYGPAAASGDGSAAAPSAPPTPQPRGDRS